MKLIINNWTVRLGIETLVIVQVFDETKSINGVYKVLAVEKLSSLTREKFELNSENIYDFTLW